MLREIAGGDLECVEEQTGAAEVDVVASDGLRDLGEGVLNVEARAEAGQNVGPGARLACANLVGRASDLVVVVAAVTATEGRAATAQAIRVFLGAASAVVVVFVVGNHVLNLVIDILHGLPRT